jgi:threonyl-tRNA synthetase
MKIPHKIVIGKEEVESRKVLARSGGDLGDVPKIEIDTFLNNIVQEVKDRTDHPELYAKG